MNKKPVMMPQVLRPLLILLLMLMTQTQAGIFDWVGGQFDHAPKELRQELPLETQQWMDSLLADLDSTQMADVHVHLLSLGHDSSGAWVNPKLRQLSNPVQYAQFKTYLSAAQVSDTNQTSQQSWDRFQDLVRHHPKKGRFFLFAFDQHYSPQGVVDSSLTSFHIPNQLAWDRAQEDPKRYVPVISVHPYKAGAIQEVHYWGQKGVRYMKWLPNAMGMNPSDRSLIPFYQAMAQYDMVLISHSGEEHAVEADEHQAYGNPQAFKLPLETGVRVILAHAATTGEHHDLDKDPQQKGDKVPSYQLLARMMDDPQYRDKLFLDLSAISLYNHLGPQVDTLLQRSDWHDRMMDGSDYPLPAVNFLIRTSKLRAQGYITSQEEEHLNRIYAINPLLFDLLTKRTMRHPKTKQRLSVSAFHLPKSLPLGQSIRN